MVIISCKPCSNIEPGRLITLGNFRRALPPKTGYFHSRVNTGGHHGWLNTETLKTRVGEFEFKNGYPTEDVAQRLRHLQTLNRATETHYDQTWKIDDIVVVP
jgi:hypothetical protein